MRALLLEHLDPLLEPVNAWLAQNGADARKLIADAEAELRRRGRNLPREQRASYCKAVIPGEFFTRWVAKNRATTPRQMIEDEETRIAEMRPFEFAAMAAGDERAFERLAPRFVRKKMVQRLGMSLGSGDEFSSYVSQNTLHLAHLLLKNFNPAARFAARKALRYFQTTAVSWYLVRRTRPIRQDAPNLAAYLASSKRLRGRTKLAVKLAYLPGLLSPKERGELRDKHGYTGAIGARLPIKKIAALLGFANPAALSRRLYRVRAWCRRSSPGRGEAV